MLNIEQFTSGNPAEIAYLRLSQCLLVSPVGSEGVPDSDYFELLPYIFDKIVPG